jgi:hypothetical protein
MDQLLLFEDSREERLEREVKRLSDQCERVRKSQYAKIGELTKMYHETRHELEILKAAICHGQYQHSTDVCLHSNFY